MEQEIWRQITSFNCRNDTEEMFADYPCVFGKGTLNRYEFETSEVSIRVSSKSMERNLIIHGICREEF